MPCRPRENRWKKKKTIHLTVCQRSSSRFFELHRAVRNSRWRPVLSAFATVRMSSKEGESKDDKAALKDDVRVQQLTARLVKLLEIKVGLDKMAKSLADPENSCVLLRGWEAGIAASRAVGSAAAGAAAAFDHAHLPPPPPQIRAPPDSRPLSQRARSEKIKAFLDTPATRVVSFFEQGGALTVTLGLPKKLPKAVTKCVAVIKPVAKKVESVAMDLLFNDVGGGEPLEHLARTIGVFIPILTNKALGLGEVVSTEVTTKLHNFLSSVNATAGALRGETCLPLPPIDPASTNALSIKERVHLLEGCVLAWTKQIKAVLKMDPEASLKSGKHPRADAELDFWSVKAKHLDAIFDQLQSERVRRVLQLLDTQRSTFCEPFAKLCKEVFTARTEAKDNVKFLATLDPLVRSLGDGDDFAVLDKKFRPIMHTLLLVWKNSRYYNTPARMVVIMRQLVNNIISAAGLFFSGKQALELIAEERATEALSKLKTLLKVTGEFKRVYFRYKATAAVECPQNPWRISNNALFSRLDAFLERIHEVYDIANVIVTFSKLEKVVIGGSKGKNLTATIDGVLAEFKVVSKMLETVTYDLLDCEATAFTADAEIFKSRVRVLERRLAATLVAAFDDSVTLFSRFKLLECFDTLLERPLIQDELEKLHIAIVRDFGADVKAVQDIYLTERSAPPLADNLPPIAGALSWCRALRERVAEPFARLKSLSSEILDREDSREVIKVYNQLLAHLDEYDAARIEEWGSDMERSSDVKLMLPLLRVRAPDVGGPVAGAVAMAEVLSGTTPGDASDSKSEGKDDVQPLPLLEVNFDPALVRLLREVRYFLLLGLEVPASALEIYKKAEMYRRCTASLDLIAGMYNSMLHEMLPVEAPLLRANLIKMDATLQRGVKEINWKSSGLDAFISESNAVVKATYDMLFSLKSNLRDIVLEMEGWSREPLLTRKQKPMNPDEFEQAYKPMRMTRYSAIQEGGKIVDKKLKESAAIMKVPKNSKEWTTYIDFVNGIVVQGLTRLVTMSLRKLCDLLDEKKIKRNLELPLIVIDLALPEGGDLVFKPDVKERVLPPGAPPPRPSEFTLYDIANGWVQSFYHAAVMFKRLDDNEGRYVKEMVGDLEVQTLLSTLNEALQRSEGVANEFRAKFEAHSFLWTLNQKAEFEKFIAGAYNELAKTEEQLREEADLKDGDVVPPQPRVPDLAKFDAEITRYNSIAESVNQMKSPTDLGWLRINSTPVKSALLALVEQWSDIFISHLRTYLNDRVNDLAKFVHSVMVGVEEEVTGDNPEALKRCMSIIREVKKTRFFRSALIAPLRQVLALFSRYAVNLDGDMVSVKSPSGATLSVVEYIDQAQLLLDAAVRRTFSKKEEIYPLQTAEMESIKVRANDFFDAVRTFWNGFRKNAPMNFQGPVSEAYQQLGDFFKELLFLEKGAEALNETEGLFELPISRFSETGQCRVQLKLLKTLWDFKSFVQFTYDSWKTALWSEVNTEVLEEANKKIMAELKKVGEMGAQVKAWGVFKDVEVMVKNMAVTLPLINELHSPSMRPRHWAQLANVCSVRELDPSDPKFCLEEMLALGLHRHAEMTSEIVDTANKEQKIEKKMDEIEAAWKVFALEFVQHKDMDIRVVKASDEVMEALDAHQMELQGIVGMGKVMEYFRARVDLAQKNLGSVEEVLKEWLSVTRNWASLESIFLASADIRAQLPDDTKRFEGIDAGFKELMKVAVETPNVIESCTKEGRGESLKEASKNLELCQRSLNEYLDMKKKIFPRFYFVSNVALLDILSNGNNPPKIMPYTGDCALHEHPTVLLALQAAR